MHPFTTTPAANPALVAPPVDVPVEIRNEALQRTSDLLKKLCEIHRELNLAPDQLPIVVETYGKTVLALLAEAERAERAKRTRRGPLLVRSETRDYQPLKIRPGTKGEIICHPRGCSFRPEDISIHSDPARWLVHNISIGNRGQFQGSQVPVPGTEFGPGGVLANMQLETVHSAMALVIVVEYVGPEPDGEVFEATLVGTSQDY